MFYPSILNFLNSRGVPFDNNTVHTGFNSHRIERIPDKTYTGYSVFWVVFQRYKRVHVWFLGHLELMQNHLKPKGPPFGFVAVLWDLILFQLNWTAVLYSLLYHTLSKLFFGSVRFFPKLLFGQRVPFRFHTGFRLWIFCFQLGKCGFRVLYVPFRVFFGTEKVIKVQKQCPLHIQETWGGTDLSRSRLVE